VRARWWLLETLAGSRTYCARMGVLEGWLWCPRCRGSLTAGEGHATCEACGFVVWANPAPTACALCEDEEGRLLLARRAREPFLGYWDIPGGFLEEDEHPLDALRRELLEESGLEIEPGDFVGAWVDTYDDRFTLNLYWRASVLGGDERPADDVSELRWFARNELPPRDELAFTTVPLVLVAWLALPPGCNVRPGRPSSAQ
jgi:ADP-ribose pyrophosphatase YjhB (NUDIX family)